MNNLKGNYLSRAEETVLAFHGAIDKAGGAAAFDEILALADNRIKEGELEGVFMPLEEEEEPGDVFATSIQVTPDNVELVSGPNEEPYAIDRKSLALLIRDRLQTAFADQVNRPQA